MKIIKFGIVMACCITASHANDHDLWFDVSLGTNWIDSPASLMVEHNFLASELTGYLNTRSSLGAAVELESRFGVAVQHWMPEWPAAATAATPNAQRYRYDWFADLTWQSSDQRTQAEFDIDRLKFAGYWGDNTLQIGRQAISLGISRVFPVIDVIQPNANFLGQSNYRPGVDAARLTHFAGALTEIDAIIVGGQATTAALRARTFANGFDWEATLLSFDGQQTIAAVSMNGGIQAYGMWLEAALYNNENAYNWRGTAGIDSTLGDVYWLTELHYNGLASAQATNTANREFYSLGAVSAANDWYISTQARYGFTLISSASAGIQYNLESSEWLINAALNTELNQAIMLQASIIIPVSNSTSERAEYSYLPSIFAIKADWTF